MAWRVGFIGLLVVEPGKSTARESNDWWSAAGEKARSQGCPCGLLRFWSVPEMQTSCYSGRSDKVFWPFETLSFPGRLSHNSSEAAQTTRHDRTCVSPSAEEREASKPVIAKQSAVTQRVLALVHSFDNPFGMIYALHVLFKFLSISLLVSLGFLILRASFVSDRGNLCDITSP